MTLVILKDLEAELKRFPQVTNAVDEAAHSQIGDSLLAAAKTILPLIPDGPAIERVLQGLRNVAGEAHAALQTFEAEAEAAKSGVETAIKAGETPTVNPPTIVDTAPGAASEVPGAQIPAPGTAEPQAAAAAAAQGAPSTAGIPPAEDEVIPGTAPVAPGTTLDGPPGQEVPEDPQTAAASSPASSETSSTTVEGDAGAPVADDATIAAEAAFANLSPEERKQFLSDQGNAVAE